MKTTRLFGVLMLLMSSCVETSSRESVADLSIDEMKSNVEAEEISLEIDTSERKSLDGNITQGVSSQERTDFDEIPAPLAPICKEPSVKTPPPPPPPWPTPPHGPTRDTNKYGVYDFAEVDPEFPGGAVEFKKFIQENLIYPNWDDSDYQGRVYVTFVVSQDGSIRDEKIMRGLSELHDKEALRLIRSMPDWIPAENNGKVVAARVRLPITFNLE